MKLFILGLLLCLLPDLAQAQCPGGMCPAPGYGFRGGNIRQPIFSRPAFRPFGGYYRAPVARGYYRQPTYGGYRSY